MTTICMRGVNKLKSATDRLDSVASAIFWLTVIVGLAILFLPTSVLADSTNSSAVNDVLGSEALKGDSNFRRDIAKYLNKPIAFIITLTGFLMINFSFLKFVFTLLYLTFPTIFDKIDAYQRTTLEMDLKNAKPQEWISYILSLIIPNVKSLTDYANGDGDMNIDVISYLKKKLPTLIGFILLGAMIFDGQGRDFLMKAADVGLFIGERAKGIDIRGGVARWLDAGESYTFVYEDGLTGNNKLKIADEIYSVVKGVNSSRNSTEYFAAVGKFTETVVESVSANMFGYDLIPAISDARSFRVKALLKTAPVNETTSVKNFPISDPVITSGAGGSTYYVVVSVSNVVRNESTVNGVIGDAGGLSYPSQAGAWTANPASKIFTLNLGPLNVINETPGTSTVSGMIKVKHKGDTTFRAEKADITYNATSSQIIFRLDTTKYKDSEIQGIEVGLGGAVRFKKPSDGKPDLLEYNPSRKFRYQY